MESDEEDYYDNYERNEMGQMVTIRTRVLHASYCENSERDIARMELRLQEDPDCLRYCGAKSYLTPLKHAVSKGHEKCVDFLLNPGGDVENLTSEAIGNVINKAIRYENEHILEYVLTKYRSLAQPELNPDYLCDVVHAKSDFKFIDIFIKHGVPVDNFEITLWDYWKISSTAYALQLGHINKLKYLLLHGAAVDHRQTGRTDLSPEVQDCLSLVHHCAAVTEYYKVDRGSQALKLLHEFGANFWQTNRHGLNPLQVRQDREYLQQEARARDLHNEIKDEEKLEKLNKKMSELMEQPLGLASWCRVSLVRSLGVKYLVTIDKLTTQHIPEHLKNFLRGDDLKID